MLTFKDGSYDKWVVDRINDVAPVVGQIKTVRTQSPADHGKWMLCDNRVMEQAVYPELFDQIGLYYNTPAEDDQADFRLPFDHADAGDHYHNFIYVGEAVV